MCLTKTDTAAIVLVLTLGFAANAVKADIFTEASSWATYDAKTNDPPAAKGGYSGALFDGQYVYFAPVKVGVIAHGEVLRYNTNAAFDNASSWAIYDPSAQGVGTNPVGYIRAVLAGQYVYFAPYCYEHPHGEVLRYDTAGEFSIVESWAAYDPGADGVGDNPDGYVDAVFDGRYVYFAPYSKSGGMHGEVLRYDTQDDFNVATSWDTYDVKTNDPPGARGGYFGVVFDGRYVYFAPSQDPGNVYHGEVLRYDTQGDFDVAASWDTYDAQTNTPPGAKGGYSGAIFDGRYVYFVPDRSTPTSFHGEVLRYDTHEPFDNASSWLMYEAAMHGVGDDPTGYGDGMFDGRYVYFVPTRHPDQHGEVLRYDTNGDFTDMLSWATYDAGDNGVGNDPDGYFGGVFDGEYIYLAPYHNGTENHGEVLRYDTLPDPPIPAVSDWGIIVMTLLVLTAGTLVCARRCGPRVTD